MVFDTDSVYGAVVSVARINSTWLAYPFEFEILIINDFHNMDFLCSSFVPSPNGYEHFAGFGLMRNVTGAAVMAADYFEVIFGHQVCGFSLYSLCVCLLH